LQAASLRIAEQYIHAFSNIAKEVRTDLYSISVDAQFFLLNSPFLYLSLSAFFFFQQGTTMLLPSSAANPASMMAQALTIYKSLIGKVPGDGSHEASSPALTLSVKGDASSRETGDECPTFAKTDDKGHLGNSKPGFSLQSHNEGT
jgi:hypothetical protein